VIIITEEPVAYDSTTDLDIDNPLIWVYKNPTRKEVEELIEEEWVIRIVLQDSDYYMASGYFFIHDDIYRLAKLRMYGGDYVINVDENSIFSNKEFYPDDVLSFYNKLKDVNLIDEHTKILYLDNDNSIPKVLGTIGDLLNGEYIIYSHVEDGEDYD